MPCACASVLTIVIIYCARRAEEVSLDGETVKGFTSSTPSSMFPKPSSPKPKLAWNVSKSFLYRILASGSYFEKGSGLPVPGVDKAKAEDMMKMMSGKSGELGWVPMG